MNQLFRAVIGFCSAFFLLSALDAEDAKNKTHEVTPYIQSIADALGRDPVRIYEWVTNNVEYTPYYGFKRGAHLTALELQGNDFDSAALLVALLKASDLAGAEMSYRWSNVWLNYGQPEDDEAGIVNACNWLSADKGALPGILDTAGLYFDDPSTKIDGETDSARIRVPHLWVLFKWNGLDYKLTPAFKAHQRRAPFDLRSIGYSPATLLGDAAGLTTNVADTDSATAYTGSTAGKNALRTRLSDYTTALVSKIGRDHHSLQGSDVVGHRSVIFSRQSALPTAFPANFSEHSLIWNSGPVLAQPDAQLPQVIPSVYLTTFRFKVGSVAYSGNTVDLQGKKLTVWFTNGRGELWLDDASVAKESTYDKDVPAEVELQFAYPKYPLEITSPPGAPQTYKAYGARNGAAPLDRTGKYVISYGFGKVLGRLNERLRLQSDYVDRKFSGTGRQLMSENLNIMALQYLNILAEMNEICGSVTNTRVHFLFHAGVAGQRDVPYVDLPNNLVTCWPSEVAAGDAGKAAAEAKSARVMLAAAYWFSLLEHTTIEQMLTGEGVSTVRMVQKAVEIGNPVYLAKSWKDYAGGDGKSGVRVLLQNYPGAHTSAQEVNNIEQGMRDGGALLIPRNASMTYNDYRGTGYMLVKPEDKMPDIGAPVRKGSSVLMGISGGMAGGWFTSIGGSMASVASTSDYLVNPNFLSLSPPFQLSFIQDPVDMTNGSFYHTVTDLALEGDSVHGLKLERRYSSARRTFDPVGMGKGWSHSYHMQMEFRHPNDFSLARASVAEVAPFLVAIKAITDIYDPNATAKEGVVPALISCWLGDQLVDTRATVTLGEKEMDFVKLPDGSYAPPPGISATLVDNGSTHTLKFRKGSEITFRDSDGKCTSVVDRNNSTATARTLSITYTSDKKPNRVTDAYGRYLQFNYAGEGRLSSVDDSTGRSVEYTWDYQNGRKGFVVKDPVGNRSRYYMDDKHRITELVDARGRTVVTSVYNDWDQITEQRMQGLDSRLGTMGFAYGATRDTDPSGATSWLYYDARGRTHTTVDPVGAVTNTVQDGNDRVIIHADALGKISEFGYDSNHELIFIRDPLDQTRAIRPESEDSVSWFRREFNFEGLETVTRYYGFHKPQSVTAPGGITEEYEYDSRGRLSRHHPASFAAGEWITYTYTETSGRLSRIVATYPVQEPVWPLTFTPAATTEIADFDGRGNLIQFIDRRGKKSTFIYDANRRVLEEAQWTGSYTASSPVGGTPPAGSLVRTFTYDANSDLATETFDGKTVAHEHDAEGRLLTVWGPDGVRQMENIYNNRGLLEATVDANGGLTTTYYDAAKRPVQSFDQIFRLVETHYDVLGRPEETVTPRGHTTFTKYDELGRVRKVIDPRDSSYTGEEGTETVYTAYDYDKDGRQKTLRNRRLKSYTTDYADLARQVTTKTPLDAAATPTRSTQTAHNTRGLTTTIIEPSGETTTILSWDKEGRVTLQKDQDGIFTVFSYYPGGLPFAVTEQKNWTGIGNSSAKSVGYSYDDFGRVTMITDGEGNVLSYTYDSSGNLQRVRHGQLAPATYFTVGYLYDEYNRLKHVLQWDIGTLVTYIDPTDPAACTPPPARTTIYAYDALGRIASITRPNGTQRVHTYDAAGQLMAAEETSTNSANPVVWARSFRYDKVGHDGEFYTNDGELTHTYTWPAPASWTPAPVNYSLPNDALSFNDDNQLETFNATAVTHDADGNMTHGPLPSSGNMASYAYDSRNRLIAAGGSSYRYGVSGARVQTTGTGAATYLVDTNGMSRVLARTVNGVTTHYVWGLGLLYQVEATSGEVRYYHGDQVGSTVAITDSSGAVTDRIDYAPFGEIVARSGNTDTPFLYNGESGVETEANGLLYMRARYYHPRLMRFINADPLRFEGGMNWYAFAGNNPVGYLDPAGTERISAATAQGILDLGASEAAGIASVQRARDEFWNESTAGKILRQIPVLEQIAAYQTGGAQALYENLMTNAAMAPLAFIGQGSKMARRAASMSDVAIPIGRFEMKAAENAGATGGKWMWGRGKINDDAAQAAYASIRESTTDVAAISRYTGYKPERLAKIKDYLFRNKEWTHADGDTAAAWHRLRTGAGTSTDRLLLKHETAEMWYRSNVNSAYSAGHRAANKKWNWQRAVEGN